MNKIACNSINYRKGFIEVADIHEGCINIETWIIHPDFDLSSIGMSFDAVPEDQVTGNTEIELSIANAKALLEQLKEAISRLEKE